MSQDQTTIIPPPEDILVYLREAARMTDYGALCHQAADEIERLRAALTQMPNEPIVAPDDAMWMAGRIREQAFEIERMRDALDGIRRHCGENGQTGADRCGRWAAEVASHVLNGGTYVE